jgi:hypothetical protein
MRRNNKDEKAKAAYNKAIIAWVTKEMARPRMAGSTHLKNAKRNGPRGRTTA